MSFDNVGVGKLMGEGLQKCLTDDGKTSANIVYINGDPTDNNAALFKQGYAEALKPAIDSGKYKLVGDQTGKWDATVAGTAFEQIYTQNGGKIDGVVSANDTMAGGIIARLKANNLAGKVPVTGQDASVAGLQAILAGHQCMTVYKADQEGGRRGLQARHRADQGHRTRGALVNGSVKDTVLNKDVPSALADPGLDLQGQREGRHRRRLPEGLRRLHRAYAAACTAAGILHLIDRLTAAGRSPARRAWPAHRSGPGWSRPTRPDSFGEEVQHDDAERHRDSAARGREQPILSLRGVNKSFGAVHVLQDVDFDVLPGQVTALVGDNGAGKSTLIKGVAGIHAFDSGDYLLRGPAGHRHQPEATPTPSASRSSTRTSRSATTSTSCTTSSSAASSTKRGVLDEATMERRAMETLAGLSVRTVAASASRSRASPAASARRSRSPARCCGTPSSSILDEPTAALGVAQTEQVLQLVRRLADRGLAVVLISHNLNDVFAVADNISVLYLGRMAAQVRPRTSPPTRSSSSSRRPVRLDRAAPTGRRPSDDGRRAPTARPSHAAAGRGRTPMSTTTARPHRREHPLPTPEPRELGAAVRDYIARVRGGDVGSLPAILGLVVLFIVFSILRPNTFTNAFNFANLVNQAAAVIVIAMGLVFVLLLGEIDLSAGWTAGVAAAIMGVTATRQGWPWWVAVLVLPRHRRGHRHRHRPAGGQARHPVVRGDAGRVPRACRACCSRSSARAARSRSATRSCSRSTTTTLPVWLGWALMAVIVAVYALVSLRRAAARRAGGLQSEGISVVIAKVVVLAVVLAAITAYLSTERSRNPLVSSIKGVPEVVVLLVVLLVGTTFVLGRTPFGRHVYAVGGNAEAARRAGINVKQIKLFCFVICSTPGRGRRHPPRQPGQLDLAHHRRRRDPAVRGGRGRHRRHQPVRRQGQAPRRRARRPRDRGDHQRHGAAEPAVQPSSSWSPVLVLLVAASVDALSRRRAASTGRV